MKSLDKINGVIFPFSWVNIRYYPDSMAESKEIYLSNDENILSELILLFYSLFSDYKDDIEVYNSSWWDYCLDTWDPKKEEYDYTLDKKSKEAQEYLLLLSESSIEIGYSGSCICLNWDKFLHVTLQCLIGHMAPFSPIFYNEANKFFFYFHYTGSIGFYYKEENEVVRKILRMANAKYDVR